LEILRKGTRFMDLERTALVLTEDSKNTRLLQLADLIVGCTLAYVGWLLGDDTFWKGSLGEPLPMKGRSYVNGPTDSSLFKGSPTLFGF
jgi:hypothetical protein